MKIKKVKRRSRTKEQKQRPCTPFSFLKCVNILLIELNMEPQLVKITGNTITGLCNLEEKMDYEGNKYNHCRG